MKNILFVFFSLTTSAMAANLGLANRFVNATRENLGKNVGNFGLVDRQTVADLFCDNFLEGSINADPNLQFQCDCTADPDDFGVFFACSQDPFVFDVFEGAATVNGTLLYDYQNKSLAKFDVDACLDGTALGFGTDGCFFADIRKDEGGNKVIDDCGGTVTVDFLGDLPVTCDICPAGQLGINFDLEGLIAFPLCFDTMNPI